MSTLRPVLLRFAAVAGLTLLASCHGPGATNEIPKGGERGQWIVLPSASVKPSPTPSAAPKTAIAASLSISVSPSGISNPTLPGGRSSAQSIVATVAVKNAAGVAIPANTLATPVVVTAYGPLGAVTPQNVSVVNASGTVTFTYTGAFFNTPLRFVAVSGAAAGEASVLPSHPSCTIPAGDTAAQITLATPALNLSKGWHMQIAVGAGAAHQVMLDTGSRGLIVPATILGPGAIGPGAAGKLEYTSDGKIFSGHYYLAPVTLDAGGANITTVPMRVLGVESQSCDPAYPNCKITTALSSIGNMGIGFARKENIGGPDVNPFLSAAAMVQGAMYPAYQITSSGVILGATASQIASYSPIALAPLSPVDGVTSFAGDWSQPSACFSFPGLSSSWFCGSMLIDSGMSGMIVGLPASKRPAPIASANPLPAGLQIAVGAPTAAGGALSYSFVLGDAMNPLAPIASASDPAARWSAGGPSINTGRNVLAGYNYLYDSACGRVGLHKLP